MCAHCIQCIPLYASLPVHDLSTHHVRLTPWLQAWQCVPFLDSSWQLFCSSWHVIRSLALVSTCLSVPMHFQQFLVFLSFCLPVLVNVCQLHPVYSIVCVASCAWSVHASCAFVVHSVHLCTLRVTLILIACWDVCRDQWMERATHLPGVCLDYGCCMYTCRMIPFDTHTGRLRLHWKICSEYLQWTICSEQSPVNIQQWQICSEESAVTNLQWQSAVENMQWKQQWEICSETSAVTNLQWQIYSEQSAVRNLQWEICSGEICSEQVCSENIYSDKSAVRNLQWKRCSGKSAVRNQQREISSEKISSEESAVTN